MTLSRPLRVLVGVATAVYVILPLVFAALVVLVALGFPLWLTLNAQPGDAPPPVIIPLFVFGVTPLQCLLIPLAFGLISFYLVHIIKNEAALETYRILLALGVVFLPFVAMPIYFLIYIWPETPPAWALAPSRRSGPAIVDDQNR